MLKIPVQEKLMELSWWQKLVVTVTFFYSLYYFSWRLLATFHPDYPIYSAIFYGGELIGFASMLLFMWSTFYLRKRSVQPILSNPSVDVYITTYNEDTEILRMSIYHALNMDYPHQTYVLDDGRRPEVEALAKSLGAGYITRPDNLHSKAGNLNSAMKKTKGDFIVVFDADGVPRKDFLTRTLGHFEDPKVALIQLPQTFYNLDSIQHSTPLPNGEPWSEQSLFFDICQTGRDAWGASICCGNGSIMRRSAVDEIGGFPVETVTEDIHLTLKLNALGYTNIFHGEPLSYCLAPATLEAFVTQRKRWALGSIQMLRIEGKRIFGPSGLTLAQRFSYLTTIYYFTSVQKLLFYMAPFLFMVFGMSPMIPQNILLPMGIFTFLSLWSFYILARGRARLVEAEVFMLFTMPGYLSAIPLGIFPQFKNIFHVTPKGLGKTSNLRFLIVPILILVLSAVVITKCALDLLAGSTDPGTFLSLLFGIFYFCVCLKAIGRSQKQPLSRISYTFQDKKPLQLLSINDIPLVKPIAGFVSVISENMLRFQSTAGLNKGEKVKLKLTLPITKLVIEATIVKSKALKNYKTNIIYEIEAEIPLLDEKTRMELIRYFFEDATPPTFKNLEDSNLETPIVTPQKNRRIQKRLRTTIPGIIHSDSKEFAVSLLRDFSEKGVSITSFQPMSLGSVVQVDVPWIDTSFTAQVRRCKKLEDKINPEFEIGLSIEGDNIQVQDFSKKMAGFKS